MSKQFHWFPGHMSKTIRELSALTKRVDVFFIVLDARAPISSYISQFDEIVKHRQKVILINKADLVDKNQLAKFVKHYKENFEYVFTISIKDKKKVKKDMLDILGKIKFTKMIPKIGILGIPNVGKSTLLNILTEGTPAKVEDRAGVTKHISWYNFNKKYWILDSPGILEPSFEDVQTGVKLAAIGSIKLEVLPLEELVIELIKFLQEKGIDFKTEMTPEEFVHHMINTSRFPEKETLIKFIRGYQTGKYGKLILDE